MSYITKPNIVSCAIVFIVVFIAYISSPIITPYDSRWSVHTSLSIIQQGNTDLNEYTEEIINNDYYAIEEIDGYYYTIFPVGTSLLAVPFVAIVDIIFEPLIKLFPALSDLFKERLRQHGIHVEELQLIHVSPAIELVIASFFCALTAVVIFSIARLRLPTSYAITIVFIFAFCTSSWSISSRALWQHGPSMLMLSFALYLLLKENKEGSALHYIAIPLALAFIVRPTNAIPILFISLYILINYRHAFLKYLLVAAPFAIVYFTYNISIYGDMFPSYTQLNRVFYATNLMEALVGNLISPSRGVFVYSPVLILSIYGFIQFFPCKNDMFNSLVFLVLVIIFCHWLLISSFPIWWAGHSYGPRFFADMMPLFMYPIVLVFEKIISLQTTKKLVILVAIAPLIMFSFYVHYKGAYIHAVYEWNVTPTNIDSDSDRLWDWNDSQIFRQNS